MRAVRVYDLASRGDLALFRAALAAGPLLGLDVGTRHVGVAASDASRRFAYPRAGFRRAGLLPDAAAVVSAAGGPATATACGAAVVGLPRAPSGRSCDGLRQFVTAYSVRVLGAAGVRHVGFVDEAYSSVVARERVAAKEKRGLTRDARRRKEAVDANAAAVILQDALDLILMEKQDL